MKNTTFFLSVMLIFTSILLLCAAMYYQGYENGYSKAKNDYTCLIYKCINEISTHQNDSLRSKLNNNFLNNK